MNVKYKFRKLYTIGYELDNKLYVLSSIYTDKGRLEFKEFSKANLFTRHNMPAIDKYFGHLLKSSYEKRKYVMLPNGNYIEKNDGVRAMICGFKIIELKERIEVVK